MIFTNAKDVINHLYSLPKLHPKSDLSYVKQVLAKLDNPQNKVKTIHVTGTNGKGSTSYYISNLLQKAGQKTGLFVSPYVYEFNERIQLNGRDISDADLVVAANVLEKILKEIKEQEPAFSLVTFEYEVALAFIFFAQEKCDYAVIEVGIGGQHDKTNVITPEVSVITTVGLDHEKIIGPTIQDIAREKSGVIKQKRPVVLGNVPESVLSLFLQRAAEKQAPIYLLNEDFTVSNTTQMLYADERNKFAFNSRPLVEEYDVAVAVKAFLLLQLPLSKKLLEEAINQTIIPGRYQVLKKTPLIIADGAHNIQAISNLLELVHTRGQRTGGRVRILIAMMKDKDLEEVFSLFNKTDQVVLTTINYPRAAKKEDFPCDVQMRYHYEEKWQAAFTKLKAESGKNDILLVTGSFYLVGELLTWEVKNAGKRN
ncbi:bifunctional folylpolyglutamate synthase/dihydrofolate synthase [Lactobacillus sp. ESL0791]|uniref:bifunctional folylpolyglutamate synthase/dihydrofolate synthase n=1 Tax=Lactobacillus sp. ESL0791 TaxID=2983234 RepID=UPI0023F73490|nr:folylpolyglutamate synthase/dihydrofolate synthase family protein [Lactobacillus sp. ESL0791]MDF7638794.1 bifunctional folylpolyglutamate synthase/dihydrofolate synthase [Lactobacillus sp. ESL0791]